MNVPRMQGFFGKIQPEAKRGVENFPENPKGADEIGTFITFAKN